MILEITCEESFDGEEKLVQYQIQHLKSGRGAGSSKRNREGITSDTVR